MEFGWKARVGLVLAAICLCAMLELVDHYWHLPHFVAFLLPLGMIWGVVWMFAGWRFDLRIAVALCAILVLGWFAANWQFERAGMSAGELVVDYWLVAGLSLDSGSIAWYGGFPDASRLCAACWPYSS